MNPDPAFFKMWNRIRNPVTDTYATLFKIRIRICNLVTDPYPTLSKIRIRIRNLVTDPYPTLFKIRIRILPCYGSVSNLIQNTYPDLNLVTDPYPNLFKIQTGSATLLRIRIQPKEYNGVAMTAYQ